MSDPGLTDLIAAHRMELDFFRVDCACGESFGSESRWYAHFGAVVEQHTNGRTTELEAELEKQKRGGRTLGKAIDRTLKWVIEASNSEDLIGDDGDGDWEIVWDRLFQLRPDLDAANARAEKAEATIARVEKLAHDMRGWCSPHGISVTYSDRICAALEGEQQ